MRNIFQSLRITDTWQMSRKCLNRRATTTTCLNSEGQSCRPLNPLVRVVGQLSSLRFVRQCNLELELSKYQFSNISSILFLLLSSTALQSAPLCLCLHTTHPRCRRRPIHPSTRPVWSCFEVIPIFLPVRCLTDVKARTITE